MSVLSKRVANLSIEARTILELRLKEKQAPLVRTEAISRREAHDLPLSFAQQRLWFFDQYEPGSSLYNVSAAVRMRGLLNRAALEQSLNEILLRQEVFRATFSSVDGDPVQV